MPTDWRAAHETAIRERDPAKITEVCEKARHAIFARLMELANFSSNTEHFLQTADLSREREDLDEALRQLVLHEYNHTS